MEFSYDNKLVIKYTVFAIFTICLILASVVFIPMFWFVAAIDAVLIYLVVGAILRIISIFNRTILVEREGIHIFRGKRKELFIPWDAIDDFSMSGSRFVIKVGDKFYYFSKELKEFDEFGRIMIDELLLPADQRGASLPALEKPESFEYSKYEDVEAKVGIKAKGSVETKEGEESASSDLAGVESETNVSGEHTEENNLEILSGEE